MTDFMADYQAKYQERQTWREEATSTAMAITDRRERLIALLKVAHEVGSYDQEVGHVIADDALIEYIADDEIAELYNSLGKWYA